MSNNTTIVEKLKAPFKADEIEWRVQQAGLKNSKAWCMVLAYVDARALQNRLDDVFGFDGWEDSYETIGDNFICTLTVNIGGKQVSKQNGASQTSIEGFKGGISNSFKRVCASGFGIGRYLYDLDTVFAETSMENPNDDKNWIRQRVKNETTNQFVTYWFKKPTLPEFAKPKLTEDQILELEQKISEKNADKKALLTHFNVVRLEEMSHNQYDMAIAMLNKKKVKQ